MAETIDVFLRQPVVVHSAPGARVGDKIGIAPEDLLTLEPRGAVVRVDPVVPEITTVSIPPWFWRELGGTGPFG